MNDLISRNAALKSLGEPPLPVWRDSDYELGMQAQWISDFNAIKNVPAVQSDANPIKYAALNYQIGHKEGYEQGKADARQESKWIPCSERLPDNDESVLISNSHGVTKAWWNGRFWTSIAVKKYKTVIA